MGENPSYQTPSSIVVDVQGFINNEGRIIPKEVTWYYLNTDVEQHSILASPFEWESLKTDAKIVNQWLTKKKHGIPWDMHGAIPTYATDLFTNIPSDVGTIYIYKKELASLLLILPHQRCVVLYDAMPHLEQAPPNECCEYHRDLWKEGKKFQCTRNNVILMRRYLLSHEPPPLESIYTARLIAKHSTHQFNGASGNQRYPEFVVESTRYLSFSFWPLNSITPQALVSEGFFYTGYRDYVKCYSCGCELGLWLPGDKIEARHSEINPLCGLIIQKFLGIEDTEIDNEIEYI